MENIIFTYDKDQSRKNGQFTVILTRAVLNHGRWEVIRGTKIFFVKDLETVARRVPDKALFRTALESEMGFRKSEARFFNPDQEFTLLRIASRHLFMFITSCQKRRILVHPNGAATMFRLDKDVFPEISVHDGRLELHLGSLTVAGADIIVRTMPVTLIKENQIIQLRPDLPFSFLEEIPTDKVLEETERNRLLTHLARQPDKLRITSVGEKAIRVMRHLTPRPILTFHEQAAKARLHFVYQGNSVKDNDEISKIIDIRSKMEIHRNRQAEEGFKTILMSQGFSVKPEHDFNWRIPDRPLESIVPSLEKQGFAVKVGSHKITEPVSVHWRIQTQNQLLKVGGTVISGDFHIGIDNLFQAFQNGQRHVERPDGSLGIISGEVRRILSELSQSGVLDQGLFTFNKADFTSIRDCLNSEKYVETDSSFEALRFFGDHLEGVRQYDIPADLETILRPYQILGFNWLRTLRELGLNGILADDMGLGKSIQVLALIKNLKQEKLLRAPVLLIAPKTLLFNWELEIRKFAPDLSTYSFAGSDRIREPAFLEQHHIILTSYGMVRNETPLLCAIKWEYVILDEAQAIKNADTLISRAVKHIPSVSRLSITGTPVENSATDLWSQFDFLMPGFLGELTAFKAAYADINNDLKRLRKKTQPYILRRLKSQVLAELPPKTEMTLYCDFTEDQKAIYNQALAAAQDEMDTLTGYRPFHILRVILRLRQIACHPQLAVKKTRKPLSSGKTEEVFHAAMEILSEGHKILIFSQFTSHLQLILELFHSYGIPSFYLDGRTPDRASVVQAFKSHQGACLFFISLKTGGTGLNLSEATYVFLLDPWWNSAAENQAVDRCHRLGQHQSVTVYRFITRGSIEEKVNDLKTIKKEIESAIIDESVPGYLPLNEKSLQLLITEEKAIP